MKRERNDEVGWLIERLREIMPDEDAPEEERPRFGRNTILRIIRLLERVPMPKGNTSRKIFGRAEVQEAVAISVLRARKRKLIKEGPSKAELKRKYLKDDLSEAEAEAEARREAGRPMSADDAGWHVAKEYGPPLFRRLTGRTLKPGTIHRLVQRAPRRPRKDSDE